uniref:RING-type E3 ubiquitin transferase n=1 Tax=Paramormyrops kingsleyae TaxID=1676925 RepID=A0A3B3SIL3_9TELE
MNRCMKSRVAELLLLVPLLHTIGEPQPDAKRPDPAAEEPGWAALPGVAYAQFREQLRPYTEKRRFVLFPSVSGSEGEAGIQVEYPVKHFMAAESVFYSRNLNIFAHICFPEISALEHQHKADLLPVSLSQLVRLQPHSSDGGGWETAQGPVLWYTIDQEVLGMATEMHEMRNSSLLLSLWVRGAEGTASQAHGSSMATNSLTLAQVQAIVWRPQLAGYEKLALNVESGKVTFDELERALQWVGDRGEGREMSKELGLMAKMLQRQHGVSADWTEPRSRQIEQYQRLCRAAESASAVLGIAEQLQLSGDFTPIRSLTQLVSGFTQIVILTQLVGGFMQICNLTQLVGGFTQIFQRLGTVLLQLHSSGNMLFHHWKALVFCSPQSRECIQVTFPLSGKVFEYQGEVTEQLQNLCRCMESCHQDWRELIGKTRSKYPCLNYYTAEQVVHLSHWIFATCRKLAKLPQSAWHLLRSIKPDCTLEEVQKAFALITESKDLPGSSDQELAMEDHANMPRYLGENLDISTLARFLSRLSEMNRVHVRREMPAVLQGGRPNLVLCPKADVLGTALSIYMHSAEQPLPSCDEVLLCQEETTAEQVELFLRRALGRCAPDDQGKIFTLINAGLLAYDVSVSLGEHFELLQRNAEPHYRLVIVCAVNHQCKYVPSFFSGYKVQVAFGTSRNKARDYLRRHFSSTARQSHVYPENTSVWLISSTRPAVGKKQNVRFGLEEFLFQLLVLGCVSDSEGNLWRRSSDHLITVELLRSHPTQQLQTRNEQGVHGLLDILPAIHCRSPKEVKELQLEIHQKKARRTLDPLMDEQEFRSEGVQRSYQYLKRYNRGENLDPFKYTAGSVEGDTVDCLHHLLVNCGMTDPSWAELKNFTWFLNLQLKDCEYSMFCDPDFLADHLKGFKGFIIKFMITMARDFATPSMNCSDQSPSFLPENMNEDDMLARLTIRKRWETEPHPYIFFNADHISMSFLGFRIQKCPLGRTLNAVHPQNNKVIMGDVMTPHLLEGLQRQGISFSENFDNLARKDKIQRISFVVGAEKGWTTQQFDPDPTYELTADNVMKMLAIHMRFRCGIPVIVMGETGCGKTRLVRFLCDLQREGKNTENMKLIKVHGGTTAETIQRKVREAERLAERNRREFGLDTILFFDEANTTESIFAIKEVLCDKTVQGHPLKKDSGLKIIAACNPYRRHSAEMVERLERAGLGYRVKAEETEDRLGKVPLRQLVYRVQPLPPSMIPLVWDFGQLSDSTELSYIRQIVHQKARSHNLPTQCHNVISEVLAESQKYMRRRKDECSFVSLRDVERSLRVLLWFYTHYDQMFPELSIAVRTLKCLALAVGVCYYPMLVSKKPYLKAISRYFPEPLNSARSIEHEIHNCQDIFLRNVQTRETIAKNMALKENVFLMVVCIELRIPLFLVGKPGSSKSLAKTVVADAMQGQNSQCRLFRALKAVHMVSFQCSPHSSPEGIISTFRQCARFQQDKNPDKYVSVVVLDEIGLAEDSPQMPLKTLHPLLEDGCIDNDTPDPHMKVGFVGISNWALDPAKMNRGIFVSRWDPSEIELVETAKGICSSDQSVLFKIQHLFPQLAKAFLEICKETDKSQFFGLRDFYSLVKMIFAVVKESQQEPSDCELAEAILRNFSGQPEDFDPLRYFQELFQNLKEIPRPSTLQMVERNLDCYKKEESRYLLLLTTNNAALPILQQRVFATADSAPEIVFGSGFPKDQEYASICRNVNRVKTCMETGRTVILLNLQNLYESLYDALNQYYVYLGGQQYVDLGLGTHRVKCRVHREFRLVVVEDQDKVYKQFPVPLINRMEKHRLNRSADLTEHQRRVLSKLQEWVDKFTSLSEGDAAFKVSDAFAGFHEDACATALLQALESRGGRRGTEEEQVFEAAKCILLNCATPEAVLRLKYSKLGSWEWKSLQEMYFREQRHVSLRAFLKSQLNSSEKSSRFMEVTQPASHLGKLLFFQTTSFAKVCQSAVGFHRCFIQDGAPSTRILLIQTDMEESTYSNELIASAKYCTMNELSSMGSAQGCSHVIFITKLSRMPCKSQYTGFQGGALGAGPSTGDIGVDSHSCAGGRGRGSALCCRLQWHRRSYSSVVTLLSLLYPPLQWHRRSYSSVVTLLSLLYPLVPARFLEVLIRKLVLLLAQQEEKMLSPREWVSKEARKRLALQEGGTLRHTLWRCLQNMLTPVLALVLGVLDRDANLDLLYHAEVDEGLVCLWLDILEDQQTLEVVMPKNSSRDHFFLPGQGQRSAAHLGRCYLQDFLLMHFRISSEEHLMVRESFSAGGPASDRGFRGLPESECLYCHLQLNESRDPPEMVRSLLLCDISLCVSVCLSVCLSVCVLLRLRPSPSPSFPFALCSALRYGTKCPVCMEELEEPVALTCEHTFCLSCLLRSIQNNQRSCPMCRALVPDSFQLTVSQGLRCQHRALRKYCNAFFLEVVSRFCLCGGGDPQEGVVELLFSLLFSKQDSAYRTRELTPFLDSVDQNPVVRSVLPKLLLQYSFQQVKDHIQGYLRTLQDHILEREDQTELYLLFVNCFQVKGSTERASSPQNLVLLIHLGYFAGSLNSRHRSYCCANAEFLLAVARLRAYLGTAARLLQAAPSELGERFLSRVRAALEHGGNDWHRVYLLRAVHRLAGVDCVQVLMNRPNRSWIFPSEVLRLQRQTPVKVDRFLCCGEPYRVLRNQVYHTLLELEANTLKKNRIDGSPRVGTNKRAHSMTEVFGMVQPLSVLFQCGRPVQESRCPECKVPIGGTNHAAVAGFRETQRSEKEASSPVCKSCHHIRLCICSLLITICCTYILKLLKFAQGISQMIQPPVKDVQQFLWRHLEEDMKVLGQSLDQNMDKTMVVMHLVLHAFLEFAEGLYSRQRGADLSSRQRREMWEKLACDSVIGPGLDGKLKQAQAQISADDSLSRSPLIMLLYGDPARFLPSKCPTDHSSKCPTDHSSFWNVPEMLTVERFSQILDQNQGQATVPLLSLFIKKASQQSEVLLTRVKIFIDVWNQLRMELSRTEMGVAERLCGTELSMDSPGEFLSLSQNGPGSCLTLLLSFLSETHNCLVRQARALSDCAFSHSDYSVPLEGVSEAQLVLCRTEQELLPLLLTHCQYTLRKGKETVSSYNLPAIESELARRFVTGKPLIQAVGAQGPPLMLFVHGGGWGGEPGICKSEGYSPLRNSLSGAVRDVLHSFPDTCDAVLLTEVALRFLAKMGGDPRVRLLAYMRDTLRMEQQIPRAVAKVPSRTNRAGTAEKPVIKKSMKNPKKRLPPEYREKLSEAERKEVKAFLALTDMDAFCRELHEILLLKTGTATQEENYDSHWE